MPLAKPLAPEGVGLALWQDDFTEQAVQGKQTGVPTDGNQRHIAARSRRSVYRFKILRDTRVGVVAIHGIELGRQCGALLRQIVLRTAAQDQHINLLLVLRDIVQATNWYGRIKRLHTAGVTS